MVPTAACVDIVVVVIVEVAVLPTTDVLVTLVWVVDEPTTVVVVTAVVGMKVTVNVTGKLGIVKVHM
jgi:hypothetical protein